MLTFNILEQDLKRRTSVQSTLGFSRCSSIVSESDIVLHISDKQWRIVKLILQYFEN